jgi:NADPH-dependent 2,4-dienoyl-CoA reductase/sulfur reductase-like enzyme
MAIMKYIIVGGVAGGAGTAARVRRLDEQAEILLVEKGAHISYANCGLPYYIGEVIQDRNKLFVQSAATFKNRFEVEVGP